MKLSLDTPIGSLRMVGPAYVQKLKKLELVTIEHLLYHSPSRYMDYSTIVPIGRAQPESVVTIQGTILAMRNVYTKSGKVIQKLTLQDDSGKLEATWFNQPFLTQTLKAGQSVSLAGEIKVSGRRKELISPEYELLNENNKWKMENGTWTINTIHTARLVPVYPETAGVSSKWLRSRIAPLTRILLPELSDWLPPKILKRENLPPLAKAIGDLHFPQSLRDAQRARERLAFDEMLVIQLTSLVRRKKWQNQKSALKIDAKEEKLKAFIDSLPFALTGAQGECVNTILEDLRSEKPMNRLLLGDVGSGKTVVAAVAMYAAFLSGAKSALMAPTEILAIQHQKTIKSLLGQCGITIAFCTASRKTNLERFDIVIGTHALLYKRMMRERFGLVVIDEQHRFGVEQRARLIRKGIAPHTLTMTATPIPRTVALTLYGDLDLSMIDEMPPGRIAVKTWVVPTRKREGAYDWIRRRVREGEQAFIVCPLIEVSSHESMEQVRAATEEFNRLSKNVFPDIPLGLLHGRLKADEKRQAIDKFRAGKTTILVSTPVVEVGIDIPQATIMMIEGAERFGLAALHQLRGRVGRGKAQSYCLLFSSSPRTSAGRLKAMETSKSGSELAELDLRIRGPGELYGARQHGFTDLRFASYSDANLILRTRVIAQAMLKKDPDLTLFGPVIKKLALLEKQIEPN